MKFIIESDDAKAVHLLNILKDLPYVTILPLEDEAPNLLKEIREAVEELKQVKAGKSKTRSAQAFLDEL
jgi:tRNA(Ser,Leu) C12 N-acetylase TAN1